MVLYFFLNLLNRIDKRKRLMSIDRWTEYHLYDYFYRRSEMPSLATTWRRLLFFANRSNIFVLHSVKKYRNIVDLHERIEFYVLRRWTHVFFVNLIDAISFYRRFLWSSLWKICDKASWTNFGTTDIRQVCLH